MKKILIAGLVAGLVLTPTISDAKVSTSVRSTTRVSTPRVSTPKTSTSRPSTIKSGTSTLKPSSSTKVPRVNKSTTNNKSTVKSTTNKNTTTNKKTTSTNNVKSTTKVDSGNYSVKKKTVTTQPITAVSNGYYDNYSTSRLRYSNNLGFWQYYGLSQMFKDNDNVSERDIAKALTEKGYTKTEINNILKDAKKEQKAYEKKNKLYRRILQCLSGLSIVAIVYMIFFRKKDI